MVTDALKQIWPEWQIEEKCLGRGSYSVVYKAVRSDYDMESYAAIKVISIPADPSELDSLRSEGLDINATRTSLQSVVNDCVGEIQLMESLKGIQNIVSIEDYCVVEKTDEIGWDIYIRMELLTPLDTYICDKKLTEEEVIKLGCDICAALEICGKRNIMHRDIKPGNIFINDSGYFKLGDFGIAHKMENMTGGLTQGRGTPNYMAPEVRNSSKYDARADIYSLGIVLYRLLNGNRLPFLDPQKQLLTFKERNDALDRRLRGEKLPVPCEASPAMADLILRACAYDPNLRFTSATEMKQALMNVANGTYQMTAENNLDSTTAVRKAPADSNQKSSQSVHTFGAAPKKTNLPTIAALVLAIMVLIGAGVFAIPKLIHGNPNEPSDEINAETADYSEFDKEQTNDTKSEFISLAELTPINANDYSLAQNCVDTLGNTYQHGATTELHTYGESIWGEYGYSKNRIAYAEYKVGYSYKKMTATLAVSDLTSNEFAGGRIEFLGDNKLLAYYDVNRKTEPIQLEIDLTGVNILKINLVYRSDDGSGDVYVLLANPTLLSAKEPGSKVIDKNIISLVTMRMTNNNDRVTVINDHTRNDILGNIYSPNNLIEMNTYGESIWGNYGYTENRTAYMEYHPGKEYSRLSGVISVSDKTAQDLNAKLMVIGDDVELVQYDIGKRSDPINVDVDLSGVSWLRIELRFHTDDGAGNFYALLSDFELHK